jgi:predicted dehydrogenase
LIESGVDVLIEKPLATTVAEADELIELAQRHGRIAQAGHLERFNPAVRATVPLLTQPMFFECPPAQRVHSALAGRGRHSRPDDPRP